eukprot:RCo016389
MVGPFRALPSNTGPRAFGLPTPAPAALVAVLLLPRPVVEPERAERLELLRSINRGTAAAEGVAAAMPAGGVGHPTVSRVGVGAAIAVKGEGDGWSWEGVQSPLIILSCLRFLFFLSPFWSITLQGVQMGGHL